MSVKSEMTALANQVRRLSGETGTLGISAMTAALAGVTAGGGSGVTIQRATGTLALNSNGNGAATCGFRPDIIFIQGAMENGVNPISASIVFPEETRYTSSNNMPGIYLAPEDTSIYAFLEFYFNLNSNGFFVQGFGIDYNLRYTELKYAKLNYVAIKYT